MDNIISGFRVVTCHESVVNKDFIMLYIALGGEFSILTSNDTLYMMEKDVCLIRPNLEHKLFSR